MYLEVEESLFEPGHDDCTLVVRLEVHIGLCVCEKDVADMLWVLALVGCTMMDGGRGRPECGVLALRHCHMRFFQFFYHQPSSSHTKSPLF